MKPAIDPSISKLLQASGFRVSLPERADGELHEQVKAFGPDGDVTYRLGAGDGVVAIVRPSQHAVRRSRGPLKDHNGKIQRSYVARGEAETPALYDPKGKEKVKVTYELEHFPSDQQAGVTLTRNLQMDACLRFAKSRQCSMAGGNILLEIQRLWRQAMPAMGVLVLEFTSGTGDADNAKVLAIDAAKRLSIYSARTTNKRWRYITDMALQGMHASEIAQKHHITQGVVRRQLAKALDDVSRRS